MIEALPTRLSGLKLLRPTVYGDSRGFLLEAYRHDAYVAVGLDVDFVQDNHSRSAGGTLRGLHFQADPGQAKLVRTVRGAIFDVVVDIRRDSPTFGQHETFELDDVTHLQLFVPVGFAHGFCVVSDMADVVYKVGSYYSPSEERGIAWDDPALGIRWPLSAPNLSERDRRNPRLADAIGLVPS